MWFLLLGFVRDYALSAISTGYSSSPMKCRVALAAPELCLLAGLAQEPECVVSDPDESFSDDGVCSGLKPDILVMAKGLASGMPLSCIAARGELMESQPPGSMGGTYAGNAVACAAACATLDVMEEEHLCANARARGEQLKKGLQKLVGRYPIGDIRGVISCGVLQLEHSSDQIAAGGSHDWV